MTEPCWAWSTGAMLGQWCRCGHLDMAHARDGRCGPCDAQADIDARLGRLLAALETLAALATDTMQQVRRNLP